MATRMDIFDRNEFEVTYRETLRKHGLQFTQIIGKGGMSRVDEVRDINTGKLWAVKHLGNSLPPAKVERFRKMLRRESAYAFDHPNVLKGEAYFEEGGNIFFIMPRMQHNLEYLLFDNGKYPLTFLLDIVVQMAAGLNYLHQNDIIHRDLKPSNILYNLEGRDIWVVICDFGLSQDKIAKLKTDLSRAILRGGRRAGTRSYSAPEQMHKQARYDKRCDIYSLGRVMDELIGQKTDWSGKEFINTFQQDRQIDALTKKVFIYKSDNPSILEGNARKHLPYSLLNLTLRCLQKNPKRRPSDAVQVFYELTKIQQECHMALRSMTMGKEALAP
jgi:serine/threonine protein kinase